MKTFYTFIVKRFLDIFISIFLVISLSPLILIIFLILKSTNKGSSIYIHPRIGFGGEVINIYKFRTMLPKSDFILKQYLSENDKEKINWLKKQKLLNDPRVTGFGKFLRKFSLDELPQIINVVKGEMSFVGPRPIVDEEINKYKESFSLYKSIKPGITGLWQVSGRNDLTYSRRVELDMYYIKNISFSLDLYIFLKTIPAVIFKKGAY